MTRGNASATGGSRSDAIVVPVADIVTNALGSAGRNAVKRALKLPRTYQTSSGVYQRNGSGKLGMPLLRFFQRVEFEPLLGFRDDVSGFAGPRIRAAVAMRVDRELSRAVRA